MGVNSLLKTVTRQRRDCDLNPDPSAPESSKVTTRRTEPPFPALTPAKAGMVPDLVTPEGMRGRVHLS